MTLPSGLRPALFIVFGLCASSAYAEGLVLEGLYDCQRATNGRAYCKRQGTSDYAPVSEDFFGRYVSLKTGRPAVTAPVVSATATATDNSTTTTNNVLIVNLSGEASDIRGQIDLLQKMLSEQKALQAGGGGGEIASQSIAEIETRISALRTKFHDKTAELSKYQTSIKPDDADMQISARRESEIQTKIPYFIPGTKETGEFWVEPFVADDGTLEFNFQFVDVGSLAPNKVRSAIRMDTDELIATKNALSKAGANSKKAHEKGIHREVQVRLACFPVSDCPPEGQKIAKSSTEIIFEVHEDGSTAARIQRNKGAYEEGYDVSIQSAMLLQAYINHVVTTGTIEHSAGSMTSDQLKDLFR